MSSSRKKEVTYYSKDPEKFDYEPLEKQVKDLLLILASTVSSDSFWIRMKLEKHWSLYNTYYYDDFIFLDKKERHADRDACEISVTVHVELI